MNNTPMTFNVNNWTFLERYLASGFIAGGPVVCGGNPENFGDLPFVKECIEADGIRVVNIAVSMSENGKCLKNYSALHVLALVLVHGTAVHLAYVRANFSRVARIGTDVLMFAGMVNNLRGWGSGVRKIFANWYNTKSPEDLAFQFMKYRQREGWAHRDVLRLAHPIAPTNELNNVFKFIVDYQSPKVDNEELKKSTLKAQVLPKIILEGLRISGEEVDVEQIIQAISDSKLPRELIPDEFLNNGSVWEALLPHMGFTALLRTLNRMTRAGILNPGSEAEKIVLDKISDISNLQRRKVHPITMLTALKTYAAGKGIKGSLTWTPQSRILEALNASLNASFETAEPSGKNLFLGIDISGSMTWQPAINSVLLPSEIAAAMALVTLKREPGATVIGFAERPVELPIHPDFSFEKTIDVISKMTFGRTNCAAPMQLAEASKKDVDLFCIYTDNDTNASEPPVVALNRYRKVMDNPSAKLFVSASNTNRLSIADPKDPYMMDLLGFDAGVPGLINTFANTN